MTLFAGTVITAVYCSSLSGIFIYERQAIMAGEWWRVATSVLVHYSLSHLAWNLLILMMWGSLVEKESRAVFLSLALLSAGTNGLLLLHPDVMWFAGASGWGIALVTYYCLLQFGRKRYHPLWLGVLLFVGAKICYEFFSGQNLFAGGDFIVLPQVHLVGFLIAVGLFVPVTVKRH